MSLEMIMWLLVCQLKETVSRNVPGGPVVKTLPSNAGGANLIPGQEAKIPHASWLKNQNTKQKQYCNTFSKDLNKKTV